jgi:hypothetical protein
MTSFRFMLITFALALAVSLGESASASSPWSGRWETAYVHNDPAEFATLDFREVGHHYLVRLSDDIPADAWDNPDCHGPADAFGVGFLIDATHMAVRMVWRCTSDGSVHASIRYFRLAGTEDSNPLNDGVVFCSGFSDSTCGLVWHRPL